MDKPLLCPAGLEDLVDAFDLDDATAALIAAYDSHLLEVSAHTNLLARSSLADRWARHYADSLQLARFIPDHASSYLDLGSGAGFPGLLLAIVHRHRPCRVTLCDSVGKKARFLKETAEALGLDITVEARRAEALAAAGDRFEVITARAVTALDKLLGLCAPLLPKDGILIAPKGERAEKERDEAEKRWTFSADLHASQTHPGARIFVIRQVRPRP
ncbi:glucose inhibited division protein B [Parvularcula bermudensis HTCC2503]|uniref:Ribosomal RNA small subunit methyltransferase G n=1 Tax=Parvularcula bermudensis (strain ATCC BAA-594 / HTCC2503 / KCTC 12087) TaxID=314260 RepID=E0TES9_PARBH|nr:16S rRNA (guanine(527)-N(7))-methyltransferase RsmG [Parvularcula bermudensis]ADM08962.1 glucose inhibited division protein B [Parvularcula bermudensis HTCC2503]